MAKRLIDANRMLNNIELLARHEDTFRQSVILGVAQTIRNFPTVNAVEVSVLEKWLYEIAWNNTGNPLCKSCEEIIRRLPGLRKFAEEYGERKEG